MFVNYFFLGFVMLMVGVAAGMPSSLQTKKIGVESTTVPILRPASSSFDDGDDDAVIIEADDTTPPLDLTPSTFNPATDCFLPPAVKGPCKAIIESWTYNPATQSCTTFSWSGCGGNLNRFSELSHCNTHCTNVLDKNNGANYTKTSDSSSKCPLFKGCGALKCASAKDPVTGCEKCECNLGAGNGNAGNDAIILGSVSGNPDDPSQQAHVLPGGKVAGGKSEEKKAVGKPEDVCHLPETRGNCRAMMTRWRYSTELKECIQFHFGGCESESFPNNFHTKEKCLEFCKGQ